jgi:hypothetical protein
MKTKIKHVKTKEETFGNKHGNSSIAENIQAAK